MKSDVIIIIPAYNPSDTLKELIKNLNDNQYTNILVINDGSENAQIFNEINKIVTVITNNENKGKGKTLKIGFEYVINNLKNILGVITVDADGQHTIEDINKIYEKFKNNNTNIIFGSRNFREKNVPIRSKLGNILFSKILKMKTKIEINDTQTGLRAIPIKYLKNFIDIEGDRFEYETNMLLYCLRNNIPIIEEKIETIYIDKNKSSHYRIIKDTIKICKTIIEL